MGNSSPIFNSWGGGVLDKAIWFFSYINLNVISLSIAQSF